MRPSDRQTWILQWMRARPREAVDVLYRDFVEEYAEATGAQYAVQFFGAPKCPQLGRDLSVMYDAQLLKRHATGLAPGDAAMGFPKWVYSYRLAINQPGDV